MCLDALNCFHYVLLIWFIFILLGIQINFWQMSSTVCSHEIYHALVIAHKSTHNNTIFPTLANLNIYIRHTYLSGYKFMTMLVSINLLIDKLRLCSISIFALFEINGPFPFLILMNKFIFIVMWNDEWIGICWRWSIIKWWDRIIHRRDLQQVKTY